MLKPNFEEADGLGITLKFEPKDLEGKLKSDCSLSKAVAVCVIKKKKTQKRGFNVISQTQMYFHYRYLHIWFSPK